MGIGIGLGSRLVRSSGGVNTVIVLGLGLGPGPGPVPVGLDARTLVERGLGSRACRSLVVGLGNEVGRRACFGVVAGSWFGIAGSLGCRLGVEVVGHGVEVVGHRVEVVGHRV